MSETYMVKGIKLPSCHSAAATLMVLKPLSLLYPPCWDPKVPQKFWKSHWCVPFTATFSKRRKIGALWSERCDTRNEQAKWHCSILYLHHSMRDASKCALSSEAKLTTHITAWIMSHPKTHALEHFYDCIPLVTPKGVLPPALCHASATREGLWASSRGHLPREKLMWQASLQLETYQLSHW